jgi:hypothetical protein
MRESRTYGSVRGALSNERPYRDPRSGVPAAPILVAAGTAQARAFARPTVRSPARTQACANALFDCPIGFSFDLADTIPARGGTDGG